jgi:hypothetical protein
MLCIRSSAFGAAAFDAMHPLSSAFIAADLDAICISFLSAFSAATFNVICISLLSAINAAALLMPYALFSSALCYPAAITAAALSHAFGHVAPTLFATCAGNHCATSVVPP